MSEGKILAVSPDLPMPPGTDSSNPNNPKHAIKNLMMTGAQADADSQHDPAPRREGFQSQSNFYSSIIYIVLTLILLLFVFRKHPRYGFLFLVVVLVLTYLERNRNRTV
jgi:hypothetical protein